MSEESFTQEQLDEAVKKAVEENSAAMQKKVDALEKRLNPQNNDDPFGPDWSPATAQDMGRDILKAVEGKFPDMAKSQQDQIVESVLAKMEERQKSELEEKKQKEDAQLQAQIDFIKETDPDFDEKKMWEFLKGYKGEQPKTVAAAYQTFKKDYKEPEEEPKIDEGKPKGEGTHSTPPPVAGDTDKAMEEAINELGLNEA